MTYPPRPVRSAARLLFRRHPIASAAVTMLAVAGLSWGADVAWAAIQTWGTPTCSCLRVTGPMLVGSVAACLGRPAGDPECTRSAQLLWNLTHGMVSLRVARPFLPWPPLAEIVDEAVHRVVEPARLTADAPPPSA